MKLHLRYIYLLLIILAISLLTGCYDDMLDSPYPGEYPEGETTVNVQMSFEPFGTTALGTRASGTAPGKIMDRIDDLCLLAYDAKGNLMEGFPVAVTAAEHGLRVEPVKREDGDASNNHSAESVTMQATFKLKVPYGRYYLYGVANLGKHSGTGDAITSTYDELVNGKYKDTYRNRDKFLASKTEWSETNIYDNCEMLGFFTKGKAESSPSTGEKTNDVMVSVDKPGITIHSWLRRCASKVTVDFDGSNLRENIYIHIKRVTLHDVPDRCVLGRPSAADGSDIKIIPYKKDASDSESRPDGNGAEILYGVGDDPDAWPSISKGSPKLIVKDSNNKPIDFHAEDAQAMFLYENMQQDGMPGDTKNKEQFPTPDGTVIGADEKKDNMPYGSYIEVEAYYSHVSSTAVSQGKLIYRFMLGRDVLNNFDVERNHHYKITMCPRGNGNDVDWHIEYKEDPGFEFHDPYYVSYLYNHDSTIRFRYKPTGSNVKVERIHAEIVGNNWWPENSETSFQDDVMELQNPLTKAERADPLNAKFNAHPYTSGTLAGRSMYLGNGFLSLKATTEKTLNQVDVCGQDYGDKWTEQGSHMKYVNDNYFYGVAPSSSRIDRSQRTYYFDGTHDETNTGREHYNYEVLEDGSYRFNLPMYTRAKNLVKRSAYTGNNPYEASPRMAYVRLTLDLSDGSHPSQIIRVEQVERVTNPKGIYRRAGNNENFDVTLMTKDSDNGTTFSPFKSDGPWMAEVLGDANFINLNGRSTIKGSTQSFVSFTVRFNKMNKDEKVRNAVIRVRYHNYSCVHLIFVRQGYDPQAIYPNGNLWNTCNMVYDGVDAEDPRDEGSLFRYGNTTQPIDVSSNYYLPLCQYPGVGDFTVPGKLNIATSDINKYDKESLSWSEIGAHNAGFNADSRVALMSDFETLYLGNNIEHGFGVLYADGATTTQTGIVDACGYCRHDDASVRNKRGMYGLFVYYWDKDSKSIYNYRNLFFPIGRSGYGHRRAWDGSDARAGVLRYSCGRTEEFPGTAAEFQPLFHDLYMRKGAIYWAQYTTSARDVTSSKEGHDVIVGEAMGMDINFFTFDVNLISRGNLQKHSQWKGCSDEEHLDACFIRRVTNKSSQPSKAAKKPKRGRL